MLYLFDLDGTLISGYMDNPNKEYDIWEPLPGRWAMLNKLRMQGHSIAIITNQGGVAFGFVTEDQCWNKIDAVLRRFQLLPVRSSGDPIPPVVYACLHDERGKAPYNDPVEASRRKPSGQMIREAMEDYGLWPDDPVDRLHVLFVGDRPEDESAAKDAGVAFQWAHVFFKG